MSLNKADVYGMRSDLGMTLAPTSVSGPNQGSVAPMATMAPVGSVGAAGNSTAFSWLGLVLLLIVARLLYHAGGKID
jgi:hypothetical protein